MSGATVYLDLVDRIGSCLNFVTGGKNRKEDSLRNGDEKRLRYDWKD